MATVPASYHDKYGEDGQRQRNAVAEKGKEKGKQKASEKT